MAKTSDALQKLVDSQAMAYTTMADIFNVSAYKKFTTSGPTTQTVSVGDAVCWDDNTTGAVTTGGEQGWHWATHGYGVQLVPAGYVLMKQEVLDKLLDMLLELAKGS